MIIIALQVWLPLNGNLNNQGIDNTTVTNNGATVDNNGKIGKCYSFSASSAKITNTLSSSVTSAVGTMSCWVKFNSFPSSGAWYCLMQLGTAGGFANCRLGVYMQYQTGIVVCINGSSDSNLYTHSLTTNQWYHLCTTFDGTTVRLYIDGVEVWNKTAVVGSYTTAASTLFVGGTNSYYFKGYMNDVRYYSTALSPNEIEILSRGLVVHYPLSLPMPNLAKGSNTDSTSTNTFIFSEATGGSTRTIEYDGGIPCAKITRNSTAHSSWSYLHYDNWDRAAIKPSTTYTLSFDVIGSGSGSIGFNGFMQGNATNNISASIETVQNTFNADKWSHLVFRTTTIADFTDKGTSQTIYMNCSYLHNTDVWIMMKNMKLEEGVNDTPWIPHTSDAGYSTMGLGSTTEYDVSGYNYHGARTDITYSSDTARYSTSSVFNGSSSRIYCGTINLGNIWSYGMWYKSANVSSSWQAVALLNTSGGDADLQLGFYTCHSESRLQSSANGKYNAQIPLPHDTNWHHFFATYDGASLKTYMDGALVNTTSITAALLARSNLTLGARCGNASGTSFNTFYSGSLSDFRLYATALSTKQIAELYNTAISISNNGTLMGYELVES